MNSPTSPNGKKGFFNPGSLERDFNGSIKLKCVLIGDISVGKTSLAVRFTQNKFEDTYRQTIGASFLSKVVKIHDDMVTYQIWDTAGQERYKSLVPMYLRGAQIALLVYDVTDPQTFANVGVWLDALHHHGDLAKTILVGNKSDLITAVDEEMVLEYAQEHGLQFVKTSAKTGDNVEKLFVSVGAKVVSEMKHDAKKVSLADTSMVIIPNREEEKHGEKRRRKCCKT